MEEVAKVEELEKKYNDEWILIEVLEQNELGEPTKGRLIAHSKRRDDVYDVMKDYSGHTAVFFAGEIPKKGYAFAY